MGEGKADPEERENRDGTKVGDGPAGRKFLSIVDPCTPSICLFLIIIIIINFSNNKLYPLYLSSGSVDWVGIDQLARQKGYIADIKVKNGGL